MNIKPTKSTEWIIVSSEEEGRKLSERLERNNNIAAYDHVKIIPANCTYKMNSSVPRRITVMPDVDLHQKTKGEGSLLDILKNRQLTFRGHEKLIVLL